MLKKKSVRKVNRTSFIVSGTLIVLKGVAAYLTGSKSMLLDAYNSLGDFFAILLTYASLKLASRPPTEKFKFGFYKSENLASILVSVFIAYAGISTLVNAIKVFSEVPQVDFAWIGTVVSAISIILSFYISRMYLDVGEKVNSPSLRAAGSERKGDVLISSLVFVGILCSEYKILYVESLISIAISLVVIKIGSEFLRDSVFALLDIAPDKELEENLKEFITNNGKIIRVKNIRLRKAGSVIFGVVEVEIEASLDLKRAHEITEDLEKSALKEFSQIRSLVFHPEPAQKRTSIFLIPLKSPKKGLKSELSNHFGRAQGFVRGKIWFNKQEKNEKVSSIKFGDKDFKILEFFKNPFLDKEIRAGLALGKWLLKEKPFDVLIITKIGEISYDFFREKLVEMYQGSIKMTINQNLKALLSGSLNKLKSPTRTKEPL